MYLRTPKRYQKQRRHLFSTRWLWLWILAPIIIIGGWQLYENRSMYAPQIEQALNSMAADARSNLATVTAPTPLPTQNPRDQLVVADNAWRQGSIDEAVQTYEGILPNDPNNVQAHYRYAYGLLLEGFSEQALAAAEETVDANPFSSDAWAIRSAALNANGRQGEAIASAMHALQLDPESARATAFMAEAYFDSNQPQRALETVERALEMDPDSYEAWLVYGRIHQESTFEFETALDAFNRAYELAPNIPAVGINIAWLDYLYTQDIDAGFEKLQAVVELNPRNTEALYALGFFAFSGYGDPNTAIDYLTRCITANPDHLRCNYYMGRVLFTNGDNEGAAEAYMRVIEIGTTDPQHYLSAGRINRDLNNCRAAIPLLQKGYELEEAQPNPSVERLGEFEDALRSCGASFTPLYSDGEQAPAPEAEATAEVGEVVDGPSA